MQIEQNNNRLIVIEESESIIRAIIIIIVNSNKIKIILQCKHDSSSKCLQFLLLQYFTYSGEFTPLPASLPTPALGFTVQQGKSNI